MQFKRFYCFLDILFVKNTVSHQINYIAVLPNAVPFMGKYPVVLVYLLRIQDTCPHVPVAEHLFGCPGYRMFGQLSWLQDICPKYLIIIQNQILMLHIWKLYASIFVLIFIKSLKSF
jgi:hypothetical protein